jgi:hypothetical protein
MNCFAIESAEFERCGHMGDLKAHGGLIVCSDCQEELDRIAWDAKHEAPLTGDKALLYADDQPKWLVAAYEHGETEEEMLPAPRAHIAECAHCRSTAGSSELPKAA